MLLALQDTGAGLSTTPGEGIGLRTRGPGWTASIRAGRFPGAGEPAVRRRLCAHPAALSTRFRSARACLLRTGCALIVDDEPLARDCVRIALQGEPQVEVIGECGDGASAIEAIRALRPDVVFLDVQMPEVSGFEVVERVGAAAMPMVVFVTAFDRYAVRAFEAHALDYVLKPFENARMLEALRRSSPNAPTAPPRCASSPCARTTGSTSCRRRRSTGSRRTAITWYCTPDRSDTASA